MFSAEMLAESLLAAGFAAPELTEREPYPEIEYPSRRVYGRAIKLSFPR